MKKLILLLSVAILVLALVGTSACAKQQELPQCPAGEGTARSDKEIVDALEKTKTVTITDFEATKMAQQYIPAVVSDPRVCFTPGEGHLSGKVSAGPVSLSFYTSLTVDLSGSSPNITVTEIKTSGGAIAGLFSGQAQEAINDAISQATEAIKLTKKYSVNFASGSATVQQTSP